MSIDEKIPPTQTTTTEDEDGEWEDVPDPQLARLSSIGSNSHLAGSVRSRSNTPGIQRPAMRRRKVGKTVFIAQPPASPRPQVPKARKRPLIAIDREQVQDVLVHGAASSVRYFGAVLTHAFQLLMKPLGFLVFLWLLAFLLTKMSSTFRTVIAPVCVLPIISRSPLCQFHHAAESDGGPAPQWADYPSLTKIQSTKFEQLLDGSVGGSGLSLEIKKAEMATKDLVTLVKVSDLKSRDLLAQSLYDFVEDAKATGKGLQRLTAKINGAVDTIMALNDHALHTIEGAQAQKERRGLLRVLWPFPYPGSALSPAAPSRATLLEQFRTSLDTHESAMRRLVLEAHASAAALDRLDAHLSALHELCARENLALGAARDALLAELWTALGGNRRRLRVYGTNLELLRDLGEYRRRAAAHVAAATQTLQAMGEEMEELRERVAAPEIAGDRIPLEVHLKSIRSGLERLQEQRVRAKERETQLMDRILGVEA